MNLERRHRESLLVLGYMYLRMGELERAGRLFSALVALAGSRSENEGAPAPDALDRLAYASLAAVELEHGDPGSALDHLRTAMDGRVLSSREAALHLLRARALWRQDRRDEARQAVEAFIALGGRLEGNDGTRVRPGATGGRA